MVHKRRLSLFSLLLAGALGFIIFSTGLAQAELPADTISLWKLEEEGDPVATDAYADEVGANPGTCAPGGCPAQVVGRVGFGVGFDSSDPTPNGIRIFDNNDDFDFAVGQSFSIELWMKPVPGTTSAAGREVMIARTNASNIQWFIGVEDQGAASSQGAAIFGISSGGTSINVAGTTPINVANAATDDWYHIVAVRDVDDPLNKQIKLYVNGIAENSAADTFATGFALTDEITLGYIRLTNNRFYNGALDEVAIYNRALPEAEIIQHYNDGLAGLGVGFVPEAGFVGDPLSGSSGTAVQFTDQSIGNISSWSWDFGDGGTSSEQNPLHTFTAAGSYDVALAVTGPYGTDTETKAAYVVISDNPPVANFTADPVSGPFPLTVNFTDSSTTPAGSITAWAWDFGDGGTSTEQNPSHTYDAAGTYTVTLTVTGTEGSDSETKADYITVTEQQQPPLFIPSGGGGGGGCFITTSAK
jgi:PKD repeat protein